MRPQKERLEARAVSEYRRLLGKEITVRRVHGYAGNSNDTDTFCGPFRVRVVETDANSVVRWMNESDCSWLDPCIDVEIVSGPRTDIRSAWIYGTSWSCGRCRRRRERSDIIEAIQEGTVTKHKMRKGKQKRKSFRVRIVRGQTAEAKTPCVYEFDTEAELDAFLLGVDEADGWLGYEITSIVPRGKLERSR